MRPRQRELRSKHVELSRHRLDYRLIQFRRHCLRNLPNPIKEPHLLQIALAEAASEAGGQVLRKPLDKPLPVFRSTLSLLLHFH